MTVEHVVVLVPTASVSPTWLFEATGGRAVVELHVPVEGNAVLSFQQDVSHRSVSREYHQRRLQWSIPPLVAGEALWELLAGLRPYAVRIAAGIASSDKRRAAAPKLTSGARAAADELAAHLAHAVQDMPLVEAIDPAMVPQLVPQEAIAELVGADTTDAALAEAVVRLSAHITPSTPGGVVYVRGLTERMQRARALARRQVRERLAVVAAMSEDGRHERDELIRRIRGWREEVDTHRALGAAAGLSHSAVQKIIDGVAKRDDAPARVAQAWVAMSAQILAQTWAPSRSPASAVTGDDEYDDKPSEWKLRQEEETARQQALAARRAQKHCAVPGCGKSSRRIVKRWQVDNTLLVTADAGDPDRTAEGHVPGLSVVPRYSGPTWTACGTVHARALIDADRAQPPITGGAPGDAPFYYAVEPFGYIADDADLPVSVREVRHSLGLVGHSLEQFSAAVSAGDMTRAADYLADLRRDVARGAFSLADLRTTATPAIHYLPGEAGPDGEVTQVRDGDIVYTRREGHDGRRLWYGPDDVKGRTWQDLADDVAPRPLIAIPQEVLQFETHDDPWNDDSWIMDFPPT
ncbi:hypothetical protein OG339_48870 (plasmid) [Streptosporangium sp. NBC_01495]|uniref:hypothetical protein n=1 Tax=Streptosporangium sp. NBC_01495 TaxID=2903899 RepID=UPI002E327D60|nr:hypothetical protein [Streptosporangium sp. NBC_01495]